MKKIKIFIIGGALLFTSFQVFATSSFQFKSFVKYSKDVIHFTPEKPNISFIARITYYNKFQDKYGSKVACSSKLHSIEGVTAAMANHIPFFTKVQIPKLKGIIGQGEFICQDRGSAVNARKASRGKFEVIDIFVNKSTKEMNRLAAKLPEYMLVKLYN